MRFYSVRRILCLLITLPPPHTRTYSNDLTNREGSENLHYSNNLSFKYKLLSIVVAILGASAQAQTIIDNPKTELPSGSKLGRDAYAYADVEYRFGNDLDKSWIVNAGMRYEF